MMEIYWNDSSFVFGHDGYLTTDYPGLKNGFTEWTNSAKQWLDGNISKEYIYVLARNAAVYSFQFYWNVLMQNGDTLKCKPGSYTFVLKKINNQWKSVHCNGTHVFVD